MGPASKRDEIDAGLATEGVRIDVMEFQKPPRVAAVARSSDESTAPSIP
jgi:hypothetical protein